MAFLGVERYPVSAWAILGHHGRQQSVRSGRISEAKETGVFEKIFIFYKGDPRTSPKLAYPPPNQPAEILIPPSLRY